MTFIVKLELFFYVPVTLDAIVECEHLHRILNDKVQV